MSPWWIKIRNLLGLTLGLCLVFSWQEHVLLNMSESMPRGLWLVQELHPRAQFVSLKPPREALNWGCARANQVLIKEVWAHHGESVCRRGRVLYREDDPSREVHTSLFSRRGDVLELSWQEGCHPIKDGEVFVLGHHPSSCDSRFFGAVPTSNLRARVSPLLLWDDFKEEMP